MKAVGSSSLLVILTLISGLLVIALFATGAMLSGQKPAASIILTIHNIAPAFMAITAGVILYLLK